MKEKFDIVIAIDPDLTSSGIAVLDVKERRYLHTGSMGFCELADYLNEWKKRAVNVGVYVEAGWMEKKSNFNINIQGHQAERISRNVGENHATGKLIAQMTKHIGLYCELVHPLRKCWHGIKGKITHEELMSFTHAGLKHSNQDQRDAMLLAWTFANLPIRIAACR